MEYGTCEPDGQFIKKYEVEEQFQINFEDADLSDRSCIITITVGKYTFETIFEFFWEIEKIRHSIEQLCFRFTRCYIDFPFDDTRTRLDCETCGKIEGGICGRNLIKLTIYPNCYAKELSKVGNYTTFVDAKEFIRTLYERIMDISKEEYQGGGISPEVFRKKFHSDIIEAYLSRDKFENDDSKVLER